MVRRPDADGSPLQSRNAHVRVNGNANARCRVSIDDVDKTPTHNRYLVAYALLMTFSFYTHYFTLFTLIAHWIAVTILSCQSHKTACYLKLLAGGLLTAIAVAYLHSLPVLFNLLTHLAQLRAGNDIGWIPRNMA